MEREQVQIECEWVFTFYFVRRRMVQMKFRSRNNNKNKRKKKSRRRRRSSSSVRKFYFHLINNNSRWWSRNKMQRNVSASIHRASAPNARDNFISFSESSTSIPFRQHIFLRRKPFWSNRIPSRADKELAVTINGWETKNTRSFSSFYSCLFSCDAFRRRRTKKWKKLIGFHLNFVRIASVAEKNV